jgi:DNA-binding protein H-NS
MKDSELAKMPVDQLWRLHEKIIQFLDRKLLQESRRLQRRLDELGPSSADLTATCRNAGPSRRSNQSFVIQMPLETWSGRGKQPRWVTELLATGKSLDEFRI